MKKILEDDIKGIKKADKKISIALMSSFVILTLQYFILIYFNLTLTSAAVVQTMSKTLVGIAFIYALPSVIKRSKMKLIIVYLVAIFIFLTNYLIFVDNQSYLNDLIFPVFFMCLPAFIYSMSIINLSIFKKITENTSIIVFIIGVILGFLIFTGHASIGSYSMTLSYYMLLPMIVYSNDLMEKFSIRALLITTGSLAIILAFGSRGAILCFLVFVILKLMRFNLKSNYLGLLYRFLPIGFLIFVILFLDNLLLYFEHLLSKYGIQSRSILLFMRGDIHLSGRDSIYHVIYNKVNENPILGLGIGGDRLIFNGGYAHNFFLEVLVNFGILIGGIVLCILLLLIIKSLITKDKEKYSISLIWLSLGFVHLMVSSSYLIDIKFWIMIGLITNFFFLKNQYRAADYKQ